MTDPSSHFPLRVGAIDTGTNAIRFVAVEFMDPRTWVDLESQRVPVRLGHSAFLTGRLEDRAMAAAVEAMSMFRRSFDTLGIVQYRAVATSAVRESRNGGEFVNRVRAESGIRLETITGSEEARLVWMAVKSRVDLEGDDRWILADLGGGSLEVSLVSSEGIHWFESHTMGTVRLLEDLSEPDAPPEQFRTLVEEYARTLRLPRSVRRRDIRGMIATGGNIEALAEMAGASADDAGVRRISLDQLQDVIGELGGRSVQERIRDFGMRDDRADVILPAACVYERVAVLSGAREIVVPGVGVKEGLLLDLMEDVTGPGVHASRLEQQAFHGALALGRRFHFDESHARHVARLALSLFDQLEDLHDLDEDDRRILLAAAVLHDVGQFVSYRKHHKHSLYLIHNSDVPSYSPAEIPLVALVARYHRRAEPKDEHYLFGDLSRGEQERVRRLGSILRVADALDREHLQRVTEVAARREDGVLGLVARGRGDLLLERWALRKKGRMLERTFDVELRFSVAEPATGPAVI